jgi:hypothetical protein
VEPWVAHEAAAWIEIAYLCERLNVLPNPGSLLDQDEFTIKRLSGIFPLLDEWRNEEQEKEMSKANQQPQRG